MTTVAVTAIGATGLLVSVGPSDAARDVHLTVAGDYGAGPDADGVLREVARLDPDAHLAVGDLAYGYSPTPYSWCNYVKQFVGEGFPFQLVAGNHESEDNNDGDINDFSACLPNQIPGIEGTYGREYFMDLPATGTPLVRAIQISPNLTFEGTRWTYTRGDAHWNWLERAIDDGRAAGAQWIVVGAHYPCLTVGANGCPAVDDVYDLLLDKRVDLVLHGHEHSYARTHQLADGIPGCAVLGPRSYDADCVADRDDDYTAGAGTVFATVGTGGIQLRDVNSDDSEAGYFAAYSGANSTPSHGVLDLRITEDELVASFVATSGGYSDSFRISPGTTTTTPTTTTTTTSTTTTTTSTPTTTTLPTSTSTTSTTLPPPTTTTPPSTTTSSTTPTTTSTTTPTTTTTTTTPPSNVIAADRFDRAESTGWGTADVGGAWTVSSASEFDVGAGAGSMSNPSGTARRAELRGVSTDAADLLVTMSSDKRGGGSGLYASIIPRSIPGGGEYRAVVRSRSDGRLTVRLDRGSSVIAPEVIVPGLTADPDRRFDVRVRAVGTNPTRLAVKVWDHDSPEPTTWLRSIDDGTAGYQEPGAVGFSVYLSSSATNAPIRTSIHELTVIDGS